MIAHEECKKHLMFGGSCMGDGFCEKHGHFAFYNNDLKILCDDCAREKNICQICGKDNKE